MSAEVLYQPDPPHFCHLPALNVSLQVNTVVQCDCGRKWVVRFLVTEGDEGWVRLRWYHLAAQRGLRKVKS